MIRAFGKGCLLTVFSMVWLGSINAGSAASFETRPNQVIDDVEKTWSIHFSVPMRSSTVISKNVYILDSENRTVPVRSRLSSDKQTLLVTPIKSFERGESYQLYLTEGIKSSDGSPVINPTILPFEVKGTPETTTVSSTTKASNEKVSNTSNNETSKNTSTSVKNSGNSSSSTSSTTSRSNTTPVLETKNDSPILDVHFRMTSFLASLTVTADKTISRVTVNGDDMHYKGQNAFNMGLAGAENGDSFKIEAYNASNKKVYSEYHTID